MKRHRGVMTSIGLFVLICAFFAANQAVLWSQASEGEVEERPRIGEDLQVLEFETLAELQMYMRVMQDSLGVTCNYCHDLQNFAATPADKKKEEARKFMRLVKEMNEGFFADYDQKITCFTCHQGRRMPIATKADLLRILAEEQR